MKVFVSFSQLMASAPSACVVTIGNFDGVHLGHTALIETTVAKARQYSLPAVVITFEPHPQQFFTSNKAPSLLMPLSAKLALFSELGIDIVCVLPFDHSLAALPPETFVEQTLVNTLHMKHLFIGYDYTFGKNRTGNAAMLTELGKQYGFTLTQVLPVEKDGITVSSTRIRAALIAGDIKEVTRLLGRHYCAEGVIVHGMKRGNNLLGFPTANVAYDKAVITPRPGVYAVQTNLFSTAPSFCSHAEPATYLNGVASIGLNPTFGDVPLTLEVFLLNFSKDIYDNYLQVYFIERLRDEIKFNSIEALIKQIKKDVADTRIILQ